MSVHNVQKEVQRYADDHGGDAFDIGNANTLKADTIAESTSGSGVTLDGVKLKDSEVTTDVINEKTSATGVTIDGTLIKDNGIDAPGQIQGDELVCDTVAGGLGFASGLGIGGTVAQGTSKSTGVTLSKSTGQITTHAADLAAAAEVTFTVTNTVISSTDIPILSIVSGGTSGSYLLCVSAVTSGTFDITIANVSAGTLGEAIVIMFALFHGQID